MNKVIDKGFRSCRFVSTIVKHPVNQQRKEKKPVEPNYSSKVVHLAW